MSLQNRVEATAKNIEGKLEEAFGDLTGDTGKQLEGQAKQAAARLSHVTEDIKDHAKDVAEAVKDTTKDISKKMD